MFSFPHSFFSSSTRFIHITHKYTSYLGPREYLTRAEATDPVTGAIVPALGMVGDFGIGVRQLFSTRPDKGVVRLVRFVPDGTRFDVGLRWTVTDIGYLNYRLAVRGTIDGLHYGLRNSPKIYGGSVREHGKITDFRSGMKEGGKVCVVEKCYEDNYRRPWCFL